MLYLYFLLTTDTTQAEQSHDNVKMTGRWRENDEIVIAKWVFSIAFAWFWHHFEGHLSSRLMTDDYQRQRYQCKIVLFGLRFY